MRAAETRRETIQTVQTVRVLPVARLRRARRDPPPREIRPRNLAASAARRRGVRRQPRLRRRDVARTRSRDRPASQRRDWRGRRGCRRPSRSVRVRCLKGLRKHRSRVRAANVRVAANGKVRRVFRFSSFFGFVIRRRSDGGAPAVRSLRLHIARAKASSSASSNEASPVPSTVRGCMGCVGSVEYVNSLGVSGSRRAAKNKHSPRPDVRTPVAFGSHPATDAPRRSPARRRRRCLRRARQPPRSPPPRARARPRGSPPRTRSSRRMRTRRPRDDDRPRTPRLRRPSPTRSRTARHPEPSLRRFEVWHHTRVSTWMSTSTRPRCSGSRGANPLGRPTCRIIVPWVFRQ